MCDVCFFFKVMPFLFHVIKEVGHKLLRAPLFPPAVLELVIGLPSNICYSILQADFEGYFISSLAKVL